MVGLATERAEHKTIMIDATCLKAHRTASSLCVKKGARAPNRAHQGWDEYQTARRCRCQGAADRVLHVGGPSQRLHGRGGAAGQPAEGGVATGRQRLYDADWFRDALKDKGIKVCIPGRKSRKKAVKYDKRRYKQCNRIETMFGRLKDWRRVATRYDRCPETFFSAIVLAAIVLFWL